MDSNDDSDDSLFGSDASSHAGSEDMASRSHNDAPVASRIAPEIPGMFFFPKLISRSFHDQVLSQVSTCGYFALQCDEDTSDSQQYDGQEDSQQKPYRRSSRNQAMLFARSLSSDPTHALPREHGHEDVQGCAGLPIWAVQLIQHLRSLLLSLPDHQLPLDVKEMIFPPNQLLSRQLILNLYTGQEGLASHVDLVNRFADGILLCSFGPQDTGTVMDFTHESQPPQHLFLPSGSVLLLSGEARYEWRHGISARQCDLVCSIDQPSKVESLTRSIRLSITIRSMLPGADIVGY